MSIPNVMAVKDRLVGVGDEWVRVEAQWEGSRKGLYERALERQDQWESAVEGKNAKLDALETDITTLSKRKETYTRLKRAGTRILADTVPAIEARLQGVLAAEEGGRREAEEAITELQNEIRGMKESYMGLREELRNKFNQVLDERVKEARDLCHEHAQGLARLGDVMGDQTQRIQGAIHDQEARSHDFFKQIVQLIDGYLETELADV